MNNYLKGLRIAVTGANGFLGQKLVFSLLEGGASVKTLEGLEASYPSNSSLLWDGFHKFTRLKRLKGKLESIPVLSELVKGIDVVCHLAAVSTVEEAATKPLKAFTTNVLGTSKIFDAAVNAGAKRFVFASSATIYGDNVGGPIPEYYTPKPISIYAKTKYQAENYLQLQLSCTDIELLILRISHVYGPNQQDNRFIPRLIYQAHRERPMKVPFKQNRIPKDDFIFIDDAVMALINAIKYPMSKQLETINVSSGSSTSLIDIADIIKDYLGIGANLHFYDAKGYWNRFLDNSRCRELLGWNLSFDLTSGLYTTVSWYKEKLQT